MRNLPARVQGIAVERKPQANSFQSVTGRRGVLHDTEGFFEGDDSVLRANGTWPNCLVGRDRDGKIRIIEYAPIGAMSMALQNLAGGTETNRETQYQIEVSGKASKIAELLVGPDRHSLNKDPELRRVLAGIMVEVRKAADVPLRHVENPSRSIPVWDSSSGWFGHADVPENIHWDPGMHDWAKDFEMARAILSPFKVVIDGEVVARGSFSDMFEWFKAHKDRIKRKGGSIRPR